MGLFGIFKGLLPTGLSMSWLNKEAELNFGCGNPLNFVNLKGDWFSLSLKKISFKHLICGRQNFGWINKGLNVKIAGLIL